MKLTAVFQKVPEGYIGLVAEYPGANIQAATLEEARTKLSEAMKLTLAANRDLFADVYKNEEMICEPLLFQES